jgi:hypothetical protein
MDFAGQDVIDGQAERGPRCSRHVLDMLDTLVSLNTVFDGRAARIEHGT